MNTSCQGWSGGWSAGTYWTRGNSTEGTVSDVERRGTSPGLLGTELERGAIRWRGCDRRDAHHALFGMTRRSIGGLDVPGTGMRGFGVEERRVHQRRAVGDSYEQQQLDRSLDAPHQAHAAATSAIGSRRLGGPSTGIRNQNVLPRP